MASIASVDCGSVCVENSITLTHQHQMHLSDCLNGRDGSILPVVVVPVVMLRKGLLSHQGGENNETKPELSLF